MAWEEHFTPRERFAVDAEGIKSPIGNTAYAALKVKDAVADRFRTRLGERPSVDTEAPQIRLRLHLRQRQALLYLDLSGESLHKRGYRVASTTAPLRETAAAGVLLRARWPEIARSGGAFLDPMCGSGTLPVEAAMMAAGIAPGILRQRFGFHSWHGHDGKLWHRLWKEAEELRNAGLHRLPPILAADIDSAAVSAARQNIRQAGLAEAVSLRQSDFRRLRPEELGLGPTDERGGTRGLVTVNPPYGIRLQEQREAEELYEELGGWLAANFTGFRAAVLAPQKELAKRLGLRAEKLNTFYNGNLKVYLAGITLDPENRFVPRRPGADLPAPDGDPTSGVNMLIGRLKKNRRSLKSYLKREGVSCYRIYDADIPQYAAAVDVYEGRYFVIQEYAPPREISSERAEQHLRELQGALVHYWEADPRHLYLKQRRRQRGGAQYERSSEEGERYIVREGGLRFFVNFTDYLDTGLFLDHRPTRAMIRELAAGARVLNLFAYTCTASVYAAAGGAATTVSVDTSNTYLQWGRDNVRLNRLPEADHRFVRSDVFDFLRSTGEHFDLIFIDPPTFSNRRSSPEDFDVQRDHPLLIDLAAARLSEGGRIIFSTNYRRFSLDPALQERYPLREISGETVPPDFARNRSIHRTFLLRQPEIQG